MKRTLLITFLLFSMTTLGITQIQTTDFESFNLEIDTFLNGSDFLGGFSGEGIFLPNNYEDTYGSWSGWSISTMTDSITPGFTNQYACISGSGADGSSHYATTFVSGETFLPITTNGSGGVSISVNNSTYAYLSMLNGDSFAKKFGGESGDDPDFLLLTIKANDDNNGVDSINFYLADYRFSDNSLDYIIDEWTDIDLIPIGRSDSLSFSLSSSDNGAFGMNTPSYFCVDNVIINALVISVDNIHATTTSLYPNPTVNKLQIESTTLKNGLLTIYNQQGQAVKFIDNHTIGDKIQVNALPPGHYYIEIKADDNTIWVDSFIKN